MKPRPAARLADPVPEGETMKYPATRSNAKGTWMPLQFTLEDRERVEGDWKRFWAHDLDRSMVWVEMAIPSDDPLLRGRHRFVPQYSSDTSAEEIVAIFNASLEAQRFIGDAYPKYMPDFGPGSAAAFMGSALRVGADTVWFEPAVQSLDEVNGSLDTDSFWYKRLHAILAAAAARWNDGVVQITFSDMGGAFDLLATLRGTENLLLDLSDNPCGVEDALRKLIAAWKQSYTAEEAATRHVSRGYASWGPLWSPGRTYMLQADGSYMISPDMFERFVLPEISDLCDFLEYPFYHLDGKGALPHLDALLSLPKLRGIQWVPGDGQPPSEEWLWVLKKIRDAGKLCQLYVGPDGARTIVKALGTKGFAFMTWGFSSERDAVDFTHFLNTV